MFAAGDSYNKVVIVLIWMFSLCTSSLQSLGQQSQVSVPLWHEVVAGQSTVDFTNDVVPILTKAGCNAGVCHAKAGGGQNGFELSLLGYEPDLDFHSIVFAGRGRRVFPAAPEQSLLLRKATGETPHAGGSRLRTSSPEYQTIARWIASGVQGSQLVAGTPATTSDQSRVPSAKVTDLSVQPSSGLLPAGGRQQLQVIASYSDGSVRDVTSLALFESNNSQVAVVNEGGLVAAQDLPGTAAIMVRYAGSFTVFRASVPLGPELIHQLAADHPIDQYLFRNLQRLGIPASESCDDATFLRRVCIDLTGRLPTDDERQAYWQVAPDQRRLQLIEQLLVHPDHAEYFANKWTSLLKNRREDANDLTANFAFHAWVRDNLQQGTPYDQMVKQLLAATGTIATNPAVAWYKRVKDPKSQMEDVSQLFLGVRLQCAQCHHHPFERWSQDDYYALTACFSRVGRKPTGVQNEDMIYHQRGLAEAQQVRSGQMLRPKALGTDLGDIQPSEDPRLKLAEWMRQPDNPFFARALVNRYWKHFFKVGLIEPEDDIRDSNPPSNPELLEMLEQYFIESGFDLRKLTRLIVTSRAYQLSSRPNTANEIDTQNYSRFYPRRMTAEVLLDSIDQLLGTQTNFANLPMGTRSVGLPDNSYNRSVPFLKVFGRPENTSVCECERVQSANLAQSLHLLNASDVKAKLSSPGGMAQNLAQSQEPIEARVEKIYQQAFCRSPNSDELQTIRQWLSPDAPTQAEFEDLLWAVINCKEFLFVH